MLGVYLGFISTETGPNWRNATKHKNPGSLTAQHFAGIHGNLRNKTIIIRNVLLDAIALDEETNTETIPYTPSLHHQKQIKAMLKNPLRWARDRERPVWKRALKRVAVILLVISLAFGSLMVVSPTARATFIRWVTEWYETHVVFRYAGDDVQGKMPQYEIGELPEGFEEEQEKYFAGEGTISRYYENDNEDVILFEYVYMQHGSMSWISTEKADIISVSVNDLDGKLAVPKEEGINSTLVWFDPEKNLQFTIDAPLGENDILHIAESVSLVETTK